MPIDYRKNEIIKHIRSLIEVNHVDPLKAVEYATHTYIIPPLEQLEFERRIKEKYLSKKVCNLYEKQQTKEDINGVTVNEQG